MLVELQSRAIPSLPAGLDLTAYRLVQEGLTNALKHARAERAQVLVRYSAGDIEVTVSDDGRGPAAMTVAVTALSVCASGSPFTVARSRRARCGTAATGCGRGSR